MAMKLASVLLLMQLSGHFSSGTCGKVLVWPTEYSHWMNMKTILDELVQRDHEVTVLTHSVSILIDPKQATSIKFEVFPTSLTKSDFEDVSLQLINKWTYDLPKDTFWSYFSQVQEITWRFSEIMMKICKDAVLNKKLMTRLQESKFDVVLADAVTPCGELLAEILKTPLVYSLRFSPGRPTTLYETMKKADIWLIRTYWDLEFPRPLLPNIEFVGGLHCKPAKTLPKVLWRFDGKKPDTLGPNTRLFKWMPQNDLLGHPKTKAFITHGGANGVYEAIYHGVPMVGIPLFGDQPDNIAHMKAKGAAVRVDFNTMSSTDLLSALKTVINDPMYKENAMKLSRIHHDQPMKPLDRAVFWIEFVMRHKGAKHLRVAAHDLPWFQYHSLDVLGFLLACVATAIFVITKCCLCFCRMFATAGKKKKME
uniref:UDP-glucuronosyltransferase n=1 Tax=Microcebus murinus TaxID=30608 RepID=A0A8C6EKF4_MICMU